MFTSSYSVMLQYLTVVIPRTYVFYATTNVLTTQGSLHNRWGFAETLWSLLEAFAHQINADIADILAKAFNYSVIWQFSTHYSQEFYNI